MNVREWALPIYTILMQLAAGTISMIWIIRSSTVPELGQEKTDRLYKNPLLLVFFTIAVAIGASHLHLSKPYLSFLAILNFHTSWLSREVVFTALFFLCVGWLVFAHWYQINTWRMRTVVGWLSIFFGWATIYCMARIYTLPTQIAWNSITTVISFILTGLLLGIIALITMLIMDFVYSEYQDQNSGHLYNSLFQKCILWFVFGAILVVSSLVATNLFQVILLKNSPHPTAQASLDLLLHLYPVLFILRLGMTIAGVGILIYMAHVYLQQQKPIKDLIFPAYITCMLILVGEILGRFLFYAIHVRIGI